MFVTFIACDQKIFEFWTLESEKSPKEEEGKSEEKAQNIEIKDEDLEDLGKEKSEEGTEGKKEGDEGEKETGGSGWRSPPEKIAFLRISTQIMHFTQVTHFYANLRCVRMRNVA